MLLQILIHSQTTTPVLSTGTCAGQHYEGSAEDSVEDVPVLEERNLHVWLIIPPAVDTVKDIIIAALNIDRMSTFTLHVAQNIGEARLVTSDVLQEVFLLHPLHRQLDSPVLPLSILKQIFFPVKVTIESLASSVLLEQST